MIKIAISQRVTVSPKGADRDCLEQDYIRYYQKFGIILIPVPNILENIERFLDESGVSGIILSGGNDIIPETYGGISCENKDYSAKRDNTEMQMIDFAIKNNIPLLGECRGMQIINIYFKGGLIQDIKSQFPAISHIGEHEIEITDNSFKQYLGTSRMQVNSYHDNGMSENELGDKLVHFAKSNDGIIEGIYHPELPIFGIMWHPERKADVLSDKLVNLFLEIIKNRKNCFFNEK